MMKFPDQEELDKPASKAWTKPVGIFSLLIALVTGMSTLGSLLILGTALFDAAAVETNTSDVALVGVCSLFSGALSLFMSITGIRMLWPNALGARAVRLTGWMYIAAGGLFILLSVVAVPMILFVEDVSTRGLMGIPFMAAMGTAAIKVGKKHTREQSDDATETPQKFGRPHQEDQEPDDSGPWQY